ncbi:MAG TPA: hypothetical protein VHC70_10660 [Phycisphaerales bacterium]|nr:hypothetical protein [Phycisphaerales bacterium]
MTWRPFCTAVHLTSLGLWAGAVAISGATAAVAFPTLHDMKVRLPELPAAFEDDAYRFAAGAVAQRVFLITDIASFVCATLAGVTLLVLFVKRGVDRARPITYVRSLAYGVALASLAATLFVVTPGIIAASKNDLNAARVGDAAASAAARKASADLHPIAKNLLMAEFLGASVALFLGAFASASGPLSPSPGAPEESEYPKPDLLKSKRG